MKYKTRITPMVCTSSLGTKCPLAVIGKSKNPKCFFVSPLPLLYKEQKNAWFDRNFSSGGYTVSSDLGKRRTKAT